MSLEHLLKARASIARAGERSRQRWWETDAHGQAGGVLLRRLFPRTAAWAATELAMEAAAAEHKRALPAIPTVTLFDLGPAVNRALTELILRHKTQGSSPDPFVVELGDDVASAALRVGLTSEALLKVVREQAGATPDRAVQVGDLPNGVDRCTPEVIGLLVASYQFSSLGRLVVPYMRVV